MNWCATASPPFRSSHSGTFRIRPVLRRLSRRRLRKRPDILARFEAQLAALHEVYADGGRAGYPPKTPGICYPDEKPETKIVVTMNARALLNFFELRCCERAQWEIRALAVEMLKLVKAVAPVIFGECRPRLPCRFLPGRAVLLRQDGRSSRFFHGTLIGGRR